MTGAAKLLFAAAARAGVCGVALVFHASPALADDIPDPFALAPEQLFDATIVSVSRGPERLWDSPAAAYIITAQDIERSGATTIAEALRLAPGVEVARTGAGSWAISVRGFNSTLANKLLVLVDGREVYDPLFSGVYWDSQETPLDDIERIEIVRGPGATMWGANAVNGVINIITKDARDTTGWLASAAAGDEGATDFSARYGAAAGDNVAWRMFGRWIERPASETLSGNNAQDAWQSWRAGLRVDAQLDARNDLSFHAETFRSDTGDLRVAPQLTPPFSTIAAEELSARGEFALARWRRVGEGDSEFSLQAYLDSNTRDRLPLDDRRTTFDLDAQYAFQTMGAHKLVAGFGYRHTRDTPDNTPLFRADRSTIVEERTSAFIQDQITLDPGRWVATLGSKFENNEYSGFEVQPSVRLQWFDGETQTAWASASRALRAPSEIERKYNIVLAAGQPTGFPLPVTIDLTPNPNFDSEEVIAYEAGYRRRMGASTSFDVALFYNVYSDLATNVADAMAISATPVLHIVLPISVTNASSAKTYGLEAVAQWRASDRLSLEATYSFLHMDVNGPGAGALDPEAAELYSPNQHVSVRAHWDYAANTALDATIYYVATLPGYAIDAYTRLDLRWSTRLSQGVRFELVGQNLLGGAHREFTAPTDVAATEVARSFYGRLVWRP